SAQVGQQLGGQPAAGGQLGARGERRIPGQQPQVQRQRGELVAGDIMELAGDPQALVPAGGVGEQGAGGEQVGVDPGQCVARGLGGTRVVGDQRSEGLEADVQGGDEQGLAVPGPAQQQV